MLILYLYIAILGIFLLLGVIGYLFFNRRKDPFKLPAKNAHESSSYALLKMLKAYAFELYVCERETLTKEETLQETLTKGVKPRITGPHFQDDVYYLEISAPKLHCIKVGRPSVIILCSDDENLYISTINLDSTPNLNKGEKVSITPYQIQIS